MSYSISTLLTRNLHDVFGENDPARRRATIDEIFTEDCVFYDPSRGSIVAATRSIASRALSGLLILTFDIRQLPNLRNWAMAGGSNGYRAAPVSRQLTPGLISSLPGTAGLPPFISFSTNYPELDSCARAVASYVCFWHLADVRRTCPDVQFLCKSGHSNERVECPLLTLGEHRLTIRSGGERGAGSRQI